MNYIGRDMDTISWQGNNRECEFVADRKMIGDTSHKEME